MKKQTQEKETIAYEPIIAGALLKFKTLGNVDFSLLIEDFEKKTNIEVRGLWYTSQNNLGKYIETLKDRTIKLRDGISLDYFIEEDNCTLREKLQKVAGNVVNSYFNNFDIKKYNQEKENALSSNKKNVLDTANILLISDIQEDYDELIKYGFKNVDYFKSIVRADKYFAEHPEELQKYHIILKGNQNVQHCCFDGDVELDRTIRELRNKTHVLETSLNRYDYGDHIKLVTYLNDNHNRRSWDTEEQTYTDIFDRIVENTLINHTLDKAGLKDKKFVPIQDYINPNRLPLPAKKSDLKILYLGGVGVNKYANDIAKQLGLNITFKEDNNYSLGRHNKTHLGDYDIIIASRLYSDSLLGMNIESTEQCKDTGRDLTLLVTYDDDSIWQFDEDDISDYQGIGSKIKLNYRYAGNLAIDSECHNKEFRVLRKSADFVSEDEEHRKYYESGIACTSGIIGASINVYNNALLQMNKTSISDLDIKSAEEFDKEYEVADKKEEERKEAALAPIRSFDSIRYAVSSYLNYRKKGLISQLPEGLKITEGKNGIKVENIYQGRTFCTITFPKEYKQKNLRIFEIQTLSKKGNLSAPETIGLYTRKYENLESVPNRPDERQANALLSIDKKINVSLSPLNDEAWHKQCELEKQKRLFLERKQKKNPLSE